MDKPFPWTCGNCATKTVFPVIGNFSIDVKRNGKIYHLDLGDVEIPTCSICKSQQISSCDDKIEAALEKEMGSDYSPPLLMGKCTIHPKAKVEVVESEGKYYFLDSYEVLGWKLNKKVWFVADQSHAFDLMTFGK